MKNKQKSFADDGWAVWIDGDDVSTVYLNDWLNPQGKSFVDLAVRIRGVRATKSLNVYIPFRVSEAELTGRIDTTNAAAVEEYIQTIRSEHPGLPIVLDADRLSYISSAGLRVIMCLRKQEPKLALINAAPEVYQVFEMTGFTEMMTIEKAYPRMSVEGCEFIAKGGNGAVYRYDPETVIKTYYNPDALPEIEQERKNARKAFVMGVNTAIPYGIVRVGDGYGTLTELLNATSITKLMIQDPEHLEEPVRYYVDTIKQMHSIEVEPGELPDLKQQVIGWAAFVKEDLSSESAAKLRALIEALPDSRTMLHGDYHTNNVMVQNGEAILIDMDTLSVGHQIPELGSMFNAFQGFAELGHETTMQFFGFPYELGTRFWRLSLARYLETNDAQALRSVEDKAKIIGYTRMLRRSMRRQEANSAAVIANCTRHLEELLPRVDTLTF